MIRTTSTTRPTRPSLPAIGSLLAVLALAMIWLARATVDRPMYVSELGADGEPTARWFELALLVLVAGAALIAWTIRDLDSRVPVIGRWRPATSIGVAAGLFLLASQVPCTSGCPLPVGDTFTLQDFVHTLSAVLAFGAASIGMLQLAGAADRPGLRRLSTVAAVSVATIAATGGIFSLVGFRTDIGGLLELIATTIAVLWLAALGGFARRAESPTAARAIPAVERDPGRTGAPQPCRVGRP